MNLHRTPYGGRHFECFSEDPLLTARIGVAYVRGVQDGGVAATVKHFVANDSETERMTLDARIDERTLREMYLAPFEAVVRRGRRMGGDGCLQRVNGNTMTESPLLAGHPAGASGASTAWSCPTGSRPDPPRLRASGARPGDARTGRARGGTLSSRRCAPAQVDEATIDDKVARILRLADARRSARGRRPAPAPRYADDQIASLVRRVAAAGFVLARNERGVLPLDRSRAAARRGDRPERRQRPHPRRRQRDGLSAVLVSPLDGLLARWATTVEVRIASA